MALGAAVARGGSGQCYRVQVQRCAGACGVSGSNPVCPHRQHDHKEDRMCNSSQEAETGPGQRAGRAGRCGQSFVDSRQHTPAARRPACRTPRQFSAYSPSAPKMVALPHLTVCGPLGIVLRVWGVCTGQSSICSLKRFPEAIKKAGKPCQRWLNKKKGAIPQVDSRHRLRHHSCRHFCFHCARRKTWGTQ